MSGDALRRLRTGIPLALASVAVVVIGREATLGLIGGLAAGAGIEAGRLLPKRRPWLLVGSLPLAGAVVAFVGGVWAIPVAFLAWWLAAAQAREGWLRAAVLSLLVGAGAAALGYLLTVDLWREWLIVLAVAVFGGESAAWLIGSRLGKHRLAPELSPRKTWEGTAAQAVFGLVTALVASIWLPAVDALILGLAGGVFGQFGDLAESWCKRRAGAKDSGTTFGAQGGFLDLIDGFLGAGLAVVVLTPLMSG